MRARRNLVTMLDQVTALRGSAFAGVAIIVVAVTMFATHGLFEWIARRR